MKIEWKAVPGIRSRYQLRVIRKDGERHFGMHELDDMLLKDERYIKAIKRELLYAVQHRLTRR